MNDRTGDGLCWTSFLNARKMRVDEAIEELQRAQRIFQQTQRAVFAGDNEASSSACLDNAASSRASGMLETVVIDRGPKGWLWEVRDPTGTALVGGKEKTRLEDQGDRALFHLLAAGWKSSDFQSP